MFKLYLQNKPHEDSYQGTFNTLENLQKYIDNWLCQHNYHAHYYRMWKKGDKTYIDFGDWHIFFYYVEYQDDLDFLGRV